MARPRSVCLSSGTGERLDAYVREVGGLRAVLRYYAEFSDEIDARLASNNALADRLEALWRRPRSGAG